MATKGDPTRLDDKEHTARCEKEGRERVDEQSVVEKHLSMISATKAVDYEYSPRPTLPTCRGHCSPYLNALVWGEQDFFVKFNSYENMIRKQIDLEIDILCSNDL